MKIGERIFLILVALLLVGIFSFGIFLVWNANLAQVENAITLLKDNFYLKIAATTVLLLLIIVILRLMFVGVVKKSKNVFLAAMTESGEIYINLNTIRDIAVKTARRNDKVHEVRVTPKIKKKGANIFVKVALKLDAVIPEESVSLQQAIKQDVEDLCGIKVQKVVVQIDNSIQPK